MEAPGLMEAEQFLHCDEYLFTTTILTLQASTSRSTTSGLLLCSSNPGDITSQLEKPFMINEDSSHISGESSHKERDSSIPRRCSTNTSAFSESIQSDLRVTKSCSLLPIRVNPFKLGSDDVPDATDRRIILVSFRLLERTVESQLKVLNAMALRCTVSFLWAWLGSYSALELPSSDDPLDPRRLEEKGTTRLSI